jgi:2-polyprenyl-6-methoxyphenol hydroxylase-like FAD-dependent oxidoreductase
MADCQVLVVGAGPTGLVLALWLTKLGVRVRIVDKTAASGTTSRALAVQARTLELYRQLDLADEIVARGHKVPAVNLWTKGARAARLPFEKIGTGLTAYSFLEIFPQDEHEKLLIAKLKQLGVTVERETELLNFSDERGGIVARLRTPNGDERCEVRFIAGCDGARSLVRESLKTGFPGGTYRQVFYVADVKGSGPAFNGELHIDLDEADFLAVFPLTDEGRARLIGTVRDERADHADTLKFEDVSARAIEHMKVEVEAVNWFSTYHLHHRVTEHFRKGHVFLLGDAAHIHSPVGGQGMNTGIGDAINLAWKLAAVLAGRAPDWLLDSYETERIGFARRLVATTDRAFTLVSAEGGFADLLRTRIAPFLLPKIIEFSFAREYLFRTVSQITLNYRDSPLSEGAAGGIHGGDRLPWVAFDAGDNFAPLAAMSWQMHVYGTAPDELVQWCRKRNMVLHQFAWRDAFDDAGFARDAGYLVRPDTYVAVAGGAPDTLENYFSARGIRC